MSKITCNIIHDLLPSYLDGICTEDSRTVVEEHLQECQECRTYKSRMGEADIMLSPEDGEELDYLKKIRRNMDLSTIVFFFIIIGISTAFLMYLETGHHPVPYMLLVPVLIICNYLMFFWQDKKKGTEKSKKIIWFNLANIVIALYSPFLMMVLVNKWISTNSFPFDLEISSLGPFIYSQLVTVMIIEIVIWIITIAVHIKTSQFYISLSGISITGFCVALYYIQLIWTLMEVDQYPGLSRVSVAILAEGFILTGICCVIDRKRKKLNPAKE